MLALQIKIKKLNLMSPFKSDKEATVIRWKLVEKEDEGRDEWSWLLIPEQLCD